MLSSEIVRGNIGSAFAVLLLTLAIGSQLLEATGRWDLTFQDSGDEAVIVTIVLCVGAAMLVAAAARPRISLSAIESPIVIRLANHFGVLAPTAAWHSFSGSPPLSLRI